VKPLMRDYVAIMRKLEAATAVRNLSGVQAQDGFINSGVRRCPEVRGQIYESLSELDVPAYNGLWLMRMNPKLTYLMTYHYDYDLRNLRTGNRGIKKPPRMSHPVPMH
jgi:hypothetical protein